MKTPKKTTKKVPQKKTPKKKVAKKTKKKKDIIVTSPVDSSKHFIVASEMADDLMIEHQLATGELLPHFIYQFCMGKKPACKPEALRANTCTHKRQTGLSIYGVNEIVRRLNRSKNSGYKIRLSPDHLKIERNVEQDGQLGVSVSVYAENMLDTSSSWGSKFEAYEKIGKNGKYKNTFPVEKALSKAERNAKRKLIPEKAAIVLIKKLMTDVPEGVAYLNAPADQSVSVESLPPKSSTPAEVEDMIRRMIVNSKTSDEVLAIDKKSQESKLLSVKFKKEVRGLASKRVDELNS